MALSMVRLECVAPEITSTPSDCISMTLGAIASAGYPCPLKCFRMSIDCSRPPETVARTRTETGRRKAFPSYVPSRTIPTSKAWVEARILGYAASMTSGSTLLAAMRATNMIAAVTRIFLSFMLVAFLPSPESQKYTMETRRRPLLLYLLHTR